MSVQSVDMFDILSLHRPFVGLRNYIHLFHNPAAGRIALNTLLFTTCSVVAQVTIGFALAVFFQRRFPGAATIRGVFLAAWIMPGLVVGAIWKWMFAGDSGVVNAILAASGLIHAHPFWLSDPHLALPAVIIANIWLGVPFNMILLSVGLAAIPRDLYEAAAMDGAGSIRSFVSITLPMMRATIAAVVSLGIIFTLQQYDLISGLTEGGPANASNVAQYWSWQLSFQTYQIGQGSALAVLMLAVTALVASIYVSSTRREVVA
ncbi:sugar ABC transporter permease [Lichenicoccus roseus]|uniref:Sugar ABC transporter permease n=2 Tax=Lichenicoccus roseus TaxID=2683649 RepID=A0A5R9J3S0_9PROT|nr:sugar ABC transporter permease [Lichenicoccus roseus]